MNLGPGSEGLIAATARAGWRSCLVCTGRYRGVRRREGASAIAIVEGPTVVTAIGHVQPCCTRCCTTRMRDSMVRIGEMPRICRDRIGEVQPCRQQRSMAGRGSTRRRLSVPEIVVRVLEKIAAPAATCRLGRKSLPTARTTSRTTCF